MKAACSRSEQISRHLLHNYFTVSGMPFRGPCARIEIHETKFALQLSQGISMDGRGRALDNIFVERLWRSVKYDDIYLHDYATV
jgi:hypothetical protein